jgi:hypothetical protein
LTRADPPDKASWLTSFFITAIVYFTLSKISPPTSTFVDRTVESLDEELTSHDQGHELNAWDRHERARSSGSDAESDEKIVSPGGVDGKPRGI